MTRSTKSPAVLAVLAGLFGLLAFHEISTGHALAGLACATVCLGYGAAVCLGCAAALLPGGDR